MKLMQHWTNNRVLGRPEGWKDEVLPCGALPITDVDVLGVRCVKSYWKPTPAEILRLIAGDVVVLYVVGSGMPPVSLEVEGVK